MKASLRIVLATAQLAGAQEGGMSERYMLSAVRSLVFRGLLRSTRGADGGHSLAVLPEQVTLRDIVDSFERPLSLQVEGLERQPHHRGSPPEA